jgi:hypothetical protein
LGVNKEEENPLNAEIAPFAKLKKGAIESHNHSFSSLRLYSSLLIKLILTHWGCMGYINQKKQDPLRGQDRLRRQDV